MELNELFLKLQIIISMWVFIFYNCHFNCWRFVPY